MITILKCNNAIGRYFRLFFLENFNNVFHLITCPVDILSVSKYSKYNMKKTNNVTLIKQNVTIITVQVLRYYIFFW